MAYAVVVTVSNRAAAGIYADTTGQQVHGGDPLFEMYSPDFYKGQLEFIAAINSASSMPSSAASCAPAE